MIKHIKENFPLYLFFGFIIGIIYFIFSLFYYIDPFSFCVIKMERDILRGNKETMRAAISLIKKEDKSAYKTLCEYTRAITEKNCFRNDWHINKSNNHYEYN